MMIGRLIDTVRTVVMSGALVALAACGGGGGGYGGKPAAPSGLSYPSPAHATVGVALAALSPTVTGTVASYAVSPALPAGLTLDTTSGVISGTATTVTAATNYTITATNAAGSTTFALALSVNPPAPSALSYTSPVQASVGTAITALDPTVTGTVTSYAVSPALPAGLAIDTTSGVISGTPTAATAQATYTVTAANAGGSTTFGIVLTVNAVATVNGVAAAGAPIPGAVVTLKDAAGQSITTTTAADGSFSLNITGLTPPFLLSVAGAGTTLYGYAGQGGIANLTPYTTVALQAYYTAQGSSVGTVFAGSLNAASFPSPAQLALLVQPLAALLQPYLVHAGVSQPQQFNPFTISFTANHTGFDIVLDRTVLASGALGFTVDNGSGTTAGTLSSVVTVVVTPGSSTVLATASVNTTTTNSATATSSTSQQNVPVGTPTQQTDLASAESGIVTMFSNLGQLAATKGSALVASDLAPYIDSNFLDAGINAAAEATKLATNLASVPPGTTLTASFVRLNGFDDVNHTLDASVGLTFTNGAVSKVGYLQTDDNPAVGMVFRRQAAGNWALYGQQTQFSAQIRVGERRSYDANSGTPDSATLSLNMQAQVRVPPGTLSAAGVSGPAATLPDCTLSPSPLTQSSVTLQHDAGLVNGQDSYDLSCAGSLSGNPPAAGTIYSFSLTKASDGSIVHQTYPLNGTTRDNGDLTQINGMSRSAFAAANTVSTIAGTTLTLTLTPPTTFPVLYSFINGFCQNASQLTSGGGSEIQGTEGNIPPGTNSGTIAIPTQCSGAAPAAVNLSVWFVGLNGENAMVGQNIHR